MIVVKKMLMRSCINIGTNIALFTIRVELLDWSIIKMIIETSSVANWGGMHRSMVKEGVR